MKMRLRIGGPQSLRADAGQSASTAHIFARAAGVMNGLGYTIVEVMIFLAVSGLLFVSAALLMSGQQAKAEFAQAIREADSQIQDVINDVSTGYYANTDNFTCSANSTGAPVVVPAGSGNQGANKGCIFIGRVIHFAVAGSGGEGFNVYTVVGRQFKENSTTRNVETLAEARPVVIDPAISKDSRQLQSGLKVRSVKYGPAAVPDVGAVGFFSAVGSYNASGTNLVSGNQLVSLVPITGFVSPYNQNEAAARTAIDNSAATSPSNPAQGVVICIDSGVNQHGEITIGSSGRRLSTKLEIKEGSCSP